MANNNQLFLIQQGVEVWNHFRGKTLDQHNLDLSGAVLRDKTLRSADLSHVNLNHVDFRRSNLRVANLIGAKLLKANLTKSDLSDSVLINTNLAQAELKEANLSDALLRSANLIESNLSGANLSRADLSNASLQSTNLQDANLSNANLRGTNLRRANLDGANLSNAILGMSIFGAVDLSKTIGLDTCTHTGPSIIDFHTLQMSGDLPLQFLRGLGLSDHYIDYIPSLFNQPIQYYSCFISFSSKDKEFTKRIYADLQNNGVRCWYAPEDMKVGDKIRSRLDEVIRLHEKLLLVLSEHSIESDWVEKEVESAFEKERKTRKTVLFPIRLDDKVMDSDTGWAADIKRSRHIGDFRLWKGHDDYKKGLDRLLRDLKST